MTNVDTPLRQDSVTQLVLQALADGPLHGWAIAQALDRRSPAARTWDAGGLYPVLRRLEDRGFVAASWEDDPLGRRARRYGLTRLGEQRLALAPADPDGRLANELAWVTRVLAPQLSVVRLLGRGAVGAVYLALDQVLQRYVAVKVLQQAFLESADVRERFVREARTNAALAHAAIVPVFALHSGEEQVSFVMQFVPGDSLAGRLRARGRLPAAEVVRILADLAGALDYAHRQRVVHRDVKPENILLHRDTGQPMLTDFGVARAVSLDAMDPHEQRAERELFWGTPQFMSPEQIAGDDDLDGRSDLYALGAVGYAMLAGKPPFEGRGPVEVAARQLTGSPQPLAGLAPGTPAGLQGAIDRCLARKPQDRWRDGASLREALLEVRPRRRWWRRRGG